MMAKALQNGMVTIHRVRENWFRLNVTAEENGIRREVKLKGFHPFNAFCLKVGDKMEINLGEDS